jgi:hypothetical protein
MIAYKETKNGATETNTVSTDHNASKLLKKQEATTLASRMEIVVL